MISLDVTFFIQVINFLLGLAIINYFFVKPVRGVIARRRSMTEASKAETEGFLNAAEQKMNEYSERIAQARAKAASLKEEIRLQAQQQAELGLSAAGAEAVRIHEETSDRIRRECAQAQEALDAQVNSFAQVALKSMLGY